MRATCQPRQRPCASAAHAVCALPCCRSGGSIKGHRSTRQVDRFTPWVCSSGQANPTFQRGEVNIYIQVTLGTHEGQPAAAGSHPCGSCRIVRVALPRKRGVGGLVLHFGHVALVCSLSPTHPPATSAGFRVMEVTSLRNSAATFLALRLMRVPHCLRASRCSSLSTACKRQSRNPWLADIMMHSNHRTDGSTSLSGPQSHR